MVDTAHVKATALALIARFCLLNAEALSQRRIRTERPLKPTPGPRAPGNPRLVHLAVDLTLELAELVRDARDSVKPGAAVGSSPASLCAFLFKEAEGVAGLDWCGDLLDALEDLMVRIDRALGLVREAPRGPAAPVPAAVICQRLASRGVSVRPATLRKWAERSAKTGAPITTFIIGGRCHYRWEEVLAYLSARSKK